MNSDNHYRSVHWNGADFCIAAKAGVQAVVFVHGFGEDLHTWDAIWPLLKPELAAVRYDLRGFGRSEYSDPQPFNHVDDLFAILDELAIDRCALVGLSMGGGIALRAALNAPERIQKLVLLSPAITAWDWSSQWRDLWRAVAAKAKAGAMADAKALWWQHPLFDSVRNLPVAREVRAGIERYSGREWIKDYQLPALPDLDRLPTLQVPTLLLTGGQDMADFQLMAELMTACASKITRKDFPELGHLLHLENPPLIASEINQFLVE
ncbi:alpha/beta hydrolase [Halioxenophilus sp. WMMB6]|uniref:alpha/beta fold hydrolase n=1 Tax=Halioxenophilus sp. WMMB6 TaxID=3073815 RepID=UPI00295F11BA|nr:alpha/beta hydrolase [Halioxenophilus sp. WMMB6]